ncbi:DUF3224 domain-containing protein [soil metagenome]
MLGISFSFTFGSYVYTGTPARVAGKVQKETSVITRASGTFEVKVTPQPTGDQSVGVAIGRMSINKKFQGDLKGTSKGEMLAVGTDVKGSAGYVAMEQVNGTLNGRTGSFTLQHSGTMMRGAPELSVTVVPDSGTGELKGLSGRMSIVIADGKHSYEFEYAIKDYKNE